MKCCLVTCENEVVLSSRSPKRGFNKKRFCSLRCQARARNKKRYVKEERFCPRPSASV